MKATGIIRKIDELGRIVIPKEIRRTMRIREMDSIEIYTGSDGEIILKKYSPMGELALFARDYADSLARISGNCVCITDKEQIIAASGSGKKVMEKGHNIVIFPQGTRVPPESTTKEYPYKTGFIGLVKEMHADIIPMALNSGKFWRKKQFLKHSGTITMEFMDPIKYEEIEKMSKEELLLKLENIIETKCVELNKI